MKKHLAIAAAILLLGAGCLSPAPSSPAPVPTPAPAPTPPPSSAAANPNLRYLSIAPGDEVWSPLEITGDAKLWYFEGSFPVRLYDASGKLLASGPAQAKGDWMTEDFVPFKATLDFKIPADEDGILELANDNPSGDPAKDQIVRIPVRLHSEASPVLE